MRRQATAPAPRAGAAPPATVRVDAADRRRRHRASSWRRMRAPVTAAQLPALCRQPAGFDGTSFYRAMTLRRRRGGLIQGGVTRPGACCSRRSRTSRPRRPASRTSTARSSMPRRRARARAQADFYRSWSARILARRRPGIGQRRRSRLCGVRPGRRGHGRGPPHPRRADLADRRARALMRGQMLDPAGPDHHRAAASR